MPTLVELFGLLLALRLVRVAPVLLAAAAWLRYSPQAPRWRVDPRPWRPSQLRSEGAAALRVLAFDAAVGVLLWAAAGRPASLAQMPGLDAATPLGAVGTFLALFVWYEVWFYAVHRLLHTRVGLRWHRQHHVAAVCSPLTAFSFSIVERSLLIAGVLAFVAMAAAIGGAHPLGLLAYGVVNQWLNLAGHLNHDPWVGQEPPPRWARVFVTPAWHAAHHARGRGNYGLFTTVLDRALGTERPRRGRG